MLVSIDWAKKLDKSWGRPWPGRGLTNILCKIKQLNATCASNNVKGIVRSIEIFFCCANIGTIHHPPSCLINTNTFHHIRTNIYQQGDLSM